MPGRISCGSASSSASSEHSGWGPTEAMGKLKLKLLDLDGFGEIDTAEPNFCNLIIYRDYIESRKLWYPVTLKHSEVMILQCLQVHPWAARRWCSDRGSSRWVPWCGNVRHISSQQYVRRRRRRRNTVFKTMAGFLRPDQTPWGNYYYCRCLSFRVVCLGKVRTQSAQTLN